MTFSSIQCTNRRIWTKTGKYAGSFANCIFLGVNRSQKNVSKLECKNDHNFCAFRPNFTMCPIFSHFGNEKTRDMNLLAHDFTKITFFTIFCDFLNFWLSVTFLSEIGFQKYFNTIFPKVFSTDPENWSKIAISCQEVIFYSNPPRNFLPAVEKKIDRLGTSSTQGFQKGINAWGVLKHVPTNLKKPPPPKDNGQTLVHGILWFVVIE